MAALNTTSADQLFAAYRTSAVQAGDAASRYTDQRGAMMGSLVRAGLNSEDVEQMLDVYERMWTPAMGAGAGMRVTVTDQDGGKPGQINTRDFAERRLHDVATRSGVTADQWALFISALTDQRKSEARVNSLSAALYQYGGYDAASEAKHEADDLIALKGEVMRAARKMNPNLDLKTLTDLAETADVAGPARFDPLRRVAAFSIGMANGDADAFKRDAFKELWSSVEPLLSPKEREVLLQRIGQNAVHAVETGMLRSSDATAKMAEAFAAYMAPDRRDHKHPMAGLGLFFQRVGNAARGLGYQTPEDVWKRAALGKVAERSHTTGLRAPSHDTDAYERMKASVKDIPDYQLRRMIREQKDALDQAHDARRSLIRRFITYNPAVRGFKRVVSYFNPEARDALKADKTEMQQLARGLGLLNAELRGRTAAEIDLATGSSNPRGQGPNPQNPQRGPAQRDGKHGIYTIVPAAAVAAERGMVYQINLDRADGSGTVPLGAVRDIASANVLIDSFEALPALVTGKASTQARALALAANAAGLSDIRVIRESGLLDIRLDQMVGQGDAMAFAYPLKTGDVIFQDQRGNWRAETLAGFAAYTLQTGNEHLQTAAKIIDLATRQDAKEHEAPTNAAAAAGVAPTSGATKEAPATFGAASGVTALNVAPSQTVQAEQAGAIHTINGEFVVDTANVAALDRTAEFRTAAAAVKQADEIQAAPSMAARVAQYSLGAETALMINPDAPAGGLIAKLKGMDDAELHALYTKTSTAHREIRAGTTSETELLRGLSVISRVLQQRGYNPRDFLEQGPNAAGRLDSSVVAPSEAVQTAQIVQSNPAPKPLRDDAPIVVTVARPEVPPPVSDTAPPASPARAAASAVTAEAPPARAILTSAPAAELTLAGIGLGDGKVPHIRADQIDEWKDAVRRLAPDDLRSLAAKSVAAASVENGGSPRDQAMRQQVARGAEVLTAELAARGLPAVHLSSPPQIDAVTVAAGAAPLRLDPTISGEARRAAVAALTDDGVKAAHTSTIAALAAAEKQVRTNRTPETVSAKMMLSAGLNALEMALRARGLSVTQVGTQDAAPNRKKRTTGTEL
jgi:hypothetical protein